MKDLLLYLRLNKSRQNEAEIKSNYIVNLENRALECVCSIHRLSLRFPLFNRYHIIFR